MINVIKHGREYKAPAPPTYYTHACRNCGCEFEFSDRDTDWTYKKTTSYGRPAFYIDCPECNARVYEWHWSSETNVQ